MERQAAGDHGFIGIDFGTANSCVGYAAYTDRGTGEVDPDPVKRPEVVTFNNDEQREERRRFIDERQGKANLFVLANDLKSPVAQMPVQEDIRAAFSIQVRLSPNLYELRTRWRSPKAGIFWYVAAVGSRNNLI